MKISIFTLTLSLFLLSCKPELNTKESNSNKGVEIDQGKKNQYNLKVKDSLVEKFFPSTRETTKNDTLIQNLGIRISIVQKPLESYIINEFISDGVKNIHKYRDFENHLVIEKGSKKIIDTIFRKENFLENTGHEFQEISIFHGYWFREAKDNQVEIFGMLSKPETDYSFAFQHFFNLKSGIFEIKKIN